MSLAPIALIFQPEPSVPPILEPEAEPITVRIAQSLVLRITAGRRQRLVPRARQVNTIRTTIRMPLARLVPTNQPMRSLRLILELVLE